MIGVTSGDPTATNYEDMVDQIGISTFNVTADKIIDIIKDHNIDSAEGPAVKFQAWMQFGTYSLDDCMSHLSPVFTVN